MRNIEGIGWALERRKGRGLAVETDTGRPSRAWSGRVRRLAAAAAHPGEAQRAQPRTHRRRREPVEHRGVAGGVVEAQRAVGVALAVHAAHAEAREVIEAMGELVAQRRAVVVARRRGHRVLRDEPRHPQRRQRGASRGLPGGMTGVRGARSCVERMFCRLAISLDALSFL